MEERTIYTAEFKDSACVRINDKGNFINSHAIKKWLMTKIEQGYQNLFIELAGCPSMDSTFMGVLTGLSLRIKRMGRAPLILTNLTNHNKNLLETLGLANFFIVQDNFVLDTSIHWEILEVESLDKLSTTKHMVESHEQLIDSGSIASRQFKSVHEMLKEDLDRQLKKKIKDAE